MTYPNDCTLPNEILEQIAEQGLDYLPELIRVVVNAAMKVERQQYLGVSPYERSEKRRDQANGFKPKTVRTRMGEIEFAVPQVRVGEYYPQALEKGLHSERALTMAMAEMYVQGTSTRKVNAIVEKLCGSQVSSSLVSKATAELDALLEAWRTRPLGEVRYLFLDARYEKVRMDGQVVDMAVLIAQAVDTLGKRRILGVTLGLGEAETFWRAFLQSLIQRGLCGVRLITSDDHAGLRQALRAVFGGVPWQRCQYHLQQNAMSYVPRREMLTEVAADIRKVFNAPDRPTAEVYLKQIIQKYEQSASRLADWMETNLPEGLTVLAFPEAHRRKLRTNNTQERLNREIGRRTDVVSIFPNQAACLRLVSAILMEQDEEWQTGRTYLSFETPS
ncbi:MAG: IS256 family transposase [Chloroflexota bacterium]